ncbi:MAG TPA: vitamin B12 dependent-methionine synthase activation domain-containing protein, partial [Saprospiraceae bacterium]|nr:vitamin B12 dependent-methionine synthase activation domain-containing protein [Saprospiraceae bacterium]
RKAAKNFLSIEAARANRFRPDWEQYTPPVPAQPGVQHVEAWPLEELTEYIDWTPFFATWELAGKFPAILDDEIVGTEARRLYHDAQSMLRRIIDEKWLRASAVFGLFPA